MSTRNYETQPARKVAFLGLGVMGHPMAGHLARAGHQVTVFNRTAAKAQAWADEYGLTFPTLVDDGTFYNAFASATGEGTIGLPLMVLIDRGMVVKKSMGASEAEAIALLGD